MLYHVTVKDTDNKGRGVFATKDFQKDEIVEECPVIVLPEKDADKCDKTILDNYMYGWKSAYEGAILLGYGFIYNHSFNPNAMYIRDFPRNIMIYKAIKLIKTGEEILVNYNGDPNSKTPIKWMDVKE